MTQMVTPPQLPKTTRLVEGEVFGVLQGFGLAHILSTEGAVFGLNKGTPGVDNFDYVVLGQRWRCTVMSPFNRVTFAQPLT